MRIKKILFALLAALMLFQSPVLAESEGVDQQHPLNEVPVRLMAGESINLKDVNGYLNYLIGGYYPSGYCMKFVADVFEDLGLRRSSACCAQHYADLFTQSNSRENIPVGADVFFRNIGGGPCYYCKSASYGHIGIYIGNNRFVHSDNGRVQISSLDDPFFSSHFSGWGMHGGMIPDGEPSNCVETRSVNYRVNANGYPLLMRSNPTTSGQILVRIPDQSVVQVSRNHNGWAHVSWNGVSGYASMQYLTPISNNVSFSDLPSNHWGYSYARKMIQSGFMTPVSGNTFSPDSPVTLAQALSTAKKILGNPKDSNRLYTVKTVKKDGKDKLEADVIDFAVKYPTVARRADSEIIQWALCRNLISESQISALDLSITKGDLALLLSKCLTYKGINTSLLQSQSASWLALEDAPVLDEKGSALLQCFNAGILSGNGNGILSGDSMITRAQAAKMFWQTYIY